MNGPLLATPARGRAESTALHDDRLLAPVRSANPFDRALELQELRRAIDTYASRKGERGSAGYRAAWLRFHRQIRSIEDLRRMRASSARLRRRNPPRRQITASSEPPAG